METSHTTAKYDRYDLMWEIESILSPTTDTRANERDTIASFYGNQCKIQHDRYNYMKTRL